VSLTSLTESTTLQGAPYPGIPLLHWRSHDGSQLYFIVVPQRRYRNVT